MAAPERTPDGRHIIVNGRRWRATDPSIPEALRTQLVRELMAARRAVKDAADDAAIASARARVQDAKVALGERGHPWWEHADQEQFAARAEAAIRTLLRSREADSSICPSDVARAIGGPEWRDRMDQVRMVAGTLVLDGQVKVTQGERTVDLHQTDPEGPIRLRRAEGFPG